MCSHLYLSWLDNMKFNLKMVFCNFVTFSELNGLDYETDLVLCFCLTFTWPQAGASLLYYCGGIFSWLWKSWTEKCSSVCLKNTMYKSKFTPTITSNFCAAYKLLKYGKIAMHMDDANQEQKYETVLFPIRNTTIKLMSYSSRVTS